MNNFFLEIDYSSPIESLTEKLSFGGQMFVLGIGTVFAVLGLIWLVLTVFKSFFETKSHKPVKNTEMGVTSVPTVKNTDDGEIVAAIICAIALAESEEEGTKFRVVSFKRR